VAASDLILFLPFIFLFWTHTSKILIVMKYNYCKGYSSSPLLPYSFYFCPFFNRSSLSLEYNFFNVALFSKFELDFIALLVKN
jgi:hypothetical protein